MSGAWKWCCLFWDKNKYSMRGLHILKHVKCICGWWCTTLANPLSHKDRENKLLQITFIDILTVNDMMCYMKWFLSASISSVLINCLIFLDINLVLQARHFAKTEVSWISMKQYSQLKNCEERLYWNSKQKQEVDVRPMQTLWDLISGPDRVKGEKCVAKCLLTDTQHDAPLTVSIFISKPVMECQTLPLFIQAFSLFRFQPICCSKVCEDRWGHALHPTVPARTSNSYMGPSPPMKRNTGPSGDCQYASFTKNLWKKDRRREKLKKCFIQVHPLLAAHS